MQEVKARQLRLLFRSTDDQSIAKRREHRKDRTVVSFLYDPTKRTILPHKYIATHSTSKCDVLLNEQTKSNAKQWITQAKQ